MAERERWFRLQAGEIEDWGVGFGTRLGTGETLSGSPKVTVHEKTGNEDQYAGVTVSAEGLNAGSVTDADGVVHAANEAAQFRVTAADDAAEGKYTLRVECATTPNARSLVETIDIDLQGPPETHGGVLTVT